MFRSLLLCLLLFALVPAWPALAVELTPFAVRNLAPAALVHGLATAEPARLNRPGQTTALVDLAIISNASLSARDGEALRFDGESYVTVLGLRRGIGERLQIGIDLPWVRHSSGFLDSFIDSWHDLFGLPDGDRNRLPKDQLVYGYAGGGKDDFLLDNGDGGFGDLRLHLAWQTHASEQLAASLYGSLKAPTGDADDLTGSGAWDISLALSVQRDFALARGGAAVWGGIGATWLGDGDLLARQAEDWAVNGWLGAGWSPLERLALKLQIDSHSALYDSKLRELGDAALMLTVGGSLALTDATTLDIGVGEDLQVNASPDVVMQLTLRHRF
ncbi:MAG: DUF3187 family protein [Desulfuromonadales bacterium]|nr:DUF3187 family protein [Desulfuromonadales bacterium]